MKLTDEPQDQNSYAAYHPVTKAFMQEYLALCQKHQMVLVPWVSSAVDGGVNCHDLLQVVPLQPELTQYTERTGACFTASPTG